MEESTKKNIKAGLIVSIIEIVLIAVYFFLCYKAITSGNLSTMFSGAETAIWFITIATLALAILIFTVKPLKTKTTIKWAIVDFAWAAWNIYSMVAA